MDLHSQGLDVVSSVGATGEVGQVELNLVPAFVQTHGHRANEGLDASGRLVVGRTESASDVFVVEHLHFEGEIFLEVLNDHDQEGQLDAEGLVGVCGAGDEVGRHVRAHDLEHTALDVGVSDTLNVSVSHAFVPNLQRLRTDRV